MQDDTQIKAEDYMESVSRFLWSPPSNRIGSRPADN